VEQMRNIKSDIPAGMTLPAGGRALLTIADRAHYPLISSHNGTGGEWTTAELKKTRVSDEELVAWRIEQLLRAGADSFCAVILAKRSHVDLHSAVDLLERGCPSKTALEILL